MKTLNLATVENSSMNNLTFHQSTILKYTFANVELHNSTSSGSILRNCELFDCTVNNSRFYDCKRPGVKVLKCEFQNTQMGPMGPSPPGFSKLPVEIREMIFKEVLVCKGKTPPLLAAVRGNKELYDEALTISRKLKVVSIRSKNVESCMELPHGVRKNMKKIRIV